MENPGKKNQNKEKKECYCITLCRAENALTAFYDERLKALGITVKQYSLLSNLERLKEASTGELALQVKLERSTLTRNIRLLEAKGWIYDRAEAGKRAHRYALAEEGKKIIKAAKKIWDDAQEEIEETIGEEALLQFLDVLHKLQGL